MATHRPAFFLALGVFLILPLLASATPGWAQIYKVTDGKNGVVFTDKPETVETNDRQNVEEVQLPELNTAAPIQAQPPAASTAPEKKSEEIAAPTVTITSPANESTIAMGPGNFSVSASAEPPLSRGERLTLLIDGQAYGAAQASSSWFVEGALRGPHDLVVQRSTTNGKSIAVSDTVRIYVLRPSVIRR